jgi:sialidase-1
MLLAPDGSLLAFCEARKESQDDASPTDMVLRRSLDEGRTWLPTQVLVHGIGREALMNPCAVVDRSTNTVILVCIKAHKVSPNRHQHFVLFSQDCGQTWSEPVDIGQRIANYDDSFVPGPGVGVCMRSGRLVIPGYSGESTDVIEENFYSRVLYSDDHGESWGLGARVPELSDESQAVELKDGSLMLNVRGNMGMSCRGVAISDNGGETWSRFYWDRALNECPCQASVVRYGFSEQDGKDFLLFANPDNAGECYGIVERTKMTVRMSFDEGTTWPVKRLVHPGPASYSTMVRLPGGDIGILFEGGEKHRREWIRFARFSLSWLMGGS